MKKLYILSLSVIVLIFAACQEEFLPVANFDLDALTVLSGEVGHEKVNLVWQAPTGDSTLKNYVINWSPNGNKTLLDPSILTYEVKGLTNGTNYKFTVQADYGDLGISGANEIKLKPVDELNLAVLPGNKMAIVQWNTPNRDDISNYTLSWEPNGQSVSIPSDKNIYQITGLDNDAEYSFHFNINYSDGAKSEELLKMATPGEVSGFLIDNNSPMANEEIQFNYNPAFIIGQTAVSWSWDFGNGDTSTEANPKYTFTSAGSYDVTIQITDDQGLTYSDTKSIPVWGLKWAYDIGSTMKPQIPAIGTDGTLYIGSEDNSNLHAINPDGTLKWVYNQLGDNIYSSASVGSDGTIYVGSKDDNLHAINPDGTQKWVFALGSNVIYSSPAIGADGTIYIGSDSDNLFAVNPDGTQKWVFNTAGSNIRSTPAIGSDGTIYVASADKNLYALNADGSIKWFYTMEGVVEGGIAIDQDGAIIVTTSISSGLGAVYAVNSDGTEKWTTATSGRVLSSPAIADGRVYFGTKDSNEFIALSSSTGAKVWSVATSNMVLGSPTVDKNGSIYYAPYDSSDNNLYVLNSDGTVKYKYATTNKVWSGASIGSDGTVYIGGTDGKLYALEFFAEGLSEGPWPTFGKNSKHSCR